MTTLAVDVGGTKIAVARVDGSGALAGPVTVRSTPAEAGAEAVVAAILQGLRELLDDDVNAVGIASAGLIDPRTGSVVGATSSISGWAGTPLAAMVRDAIGRRVTVVGDGIAFALGEAAFGAARSADSAVVIAVGTGVGGGYINHKQALLGARGGAGHFGHIPSPAAGDLPCPCGGVGHLEAIASGPGLLGWYRRHGGAAASSARDIAQRADRDRLARDALTQAGWALGAGAAGLANAFDPEVVVVTGGLAGAGAIWRAAVQSGYRQGLMRSLAGLPLLISDPSDWLVLRGAALAAEQARRA